MTIMITSEKLAIFAAIVGVLAAVGASSNLKTDIKATQTPIGSFSISTEVNGEIGSHKDKNPQAHNGMKGLEWLSTSPPEKQLVQNIVVQTPALSSEPFYGHTSEEKVALKKLQRAMDSLVTNLPDSIGKTYESTAKDIGAVNREKINHEERKNESKRLTKLFLPLRHLTPYELRAMNERADYLDQLGKRLKEKFDMLREAASKAQIYDEPLKWPKNVIGVDLDGNSISSIGIQSGGVPFDIDGDGIKDASQWLSGNDGYLVIDKNRNGIIDSINEFIGDNDPNPTVQLVKFDSNNDGVISKSDKSWKLIAAWYDNNRNGITEKKELIYLDALKIQSINVGISEFDAITANVMDIKGVAKINLDHKNVKSKSAIFVLRPKYEKIN